MWRFSGSGLWPMGGHWIPDGVGMLMRWSLNSWKVIGLTAVAAASIAGTAAFVLAQESHSRPGDRTPSQLAAERMGDTSDNQRAILADGAVTREEYESAVNATVTCLAAQGFAVQPADRGDGTLGFTFATADKELGARYAAAYKDCHAANQRDVDLVWGKQLADAKPQPAADTVAAARASIAECLDGRGVKGVAHDAALLDMLATVQKAGKTSDQFYQCAALADAKFGALPTE